MSNKAFCKSCNNEFIKSHHLNKYCSNKCKDNVRKIIHRVSQEKYRKNNWEKVKKKNNQYFKIRSEKDLNYQKKIYQTFKLNNPETYKNRYIRSNRLTRNDPIKLEKKRKAVRLWTKRKRSNDPWFKIRSNLSGRLNQFLKTKNQRKNSSIVTLIGCSKKELVNYLESKFYNHPKTNEKMSWKNYGKLKLGEKKVWEIDHKIPYDYYKELNLEDINIQKKINHYTNLQPMWSEYNRQKSNKY